MDFQFLRSTSIVFVVTVMATACAVIPNTPLPMSAKDSPDLQISYEKFELENGLDVILHVDRSDPVVAVSSLFHVGSSREVKGRTGFAHFFEHMAFNDSENVPRGANRKYIEELGGARNGGTSSDYTQYYEVVPSDALEKIFWIDSDRMGYMINTVTEEALAREKEVVKNEKRQRVDNAPYGHTFGVLSEALYPDGHPYSWSVIGTLADLQSATLEDVKEFYERWYGANNATLVVAGDFDPALVKRQIKRWFGEMRRGPEVQAMPPQPVRLTETRRLWYPDSFAQLPELTRIYTGVESYHQDSYALEVLAEVLAGSKQSPLYRSIVIDKKLAPGVGAFSRARELTGEIIVRVRALEGVALDEVQSALEAGLDQFAENGFDDAELQRIKAELEVQFYQGVSSVLSKARLLANYNEFGGDPGLIGEQIRRLQAVTHEDVIRVFQRYVHNKPFVQTSFVPKDSPELAVSGSVLARVIEEAVIQGAESAVSQGDIADYEKTPSRFDRSEPPLGELPVFRSPDIWSDSLPNGIEIVGIENYEAPLASFSLLLPGGRWRDTQDQLGAASLLAALATQGTASRTPAELELATGLLGARISFRVGAETLAIYVDTLERNLEQTIALLEEMILQPRWDRDEFERLRSSAQASIAAAEGDANALAGRTWSRLVYGEDHPFGRAGRGTPESLAALKIENLQQWFSLNVKPRGARLQVVGAVDRTRVLQAFAGLAQRWKGSAPPVADYPLAAPSRGNQVYFVDLPGAKQSVIRVGKRVMPVTDPDWVRLGYANERLGRGSSGRLMQLLRIEKGYTYGARSTLGASRYAASPWFASTSVRANVTLESMELLREQIQNYGNTFTGIDADVTKTQIVKRKARAYETPGAKLGLLNRIALQGVPYDIVEREIALLQAMMVDEFQQVFADNLSEEDMVWVVVGDAQSQLGRIAGFGYGDPIQLNSQGAIVASPEP